MTSAAKVICSADGPIGTIVLNRPNQRNAIDAETTALLRDALDWLEDDPALRIGIIRGNGPVFCAGMDLKAFLKGEGDDILFKSGGFAGIVARARSKPLIASVHGAALAGGFEILLACDLAVVTPTAQLGLPETKRGLIAGGGGVLRLGQRIPQALATEMLLTGEPITGARAHELGLANRVFDEEELAEGTRAYASAIAANSPQAITRTLCLQRAPLNRDEAGCWEVSNSLLKETLTSVDAIEGAQAFSEKRTPEWTGGAN